MTFGKKLKKLRTELRKSQAKVTQEISSMFPDFSISQTYLSALENKTNAPREEILDILAEYFGVEITYFFEDESQEIKRSGVELAKSRLRKLKNMQFTNGQVFARTEGFQSENDEIAESLQSMVDDEDVDW